jgi:hypothetical protein
LLSALQSSFGGFVVSELESADLTVARRSVLLDTIDPDPDQNFTDAVPTPGGDETPPREGLPPDYRMRADTHYVDALLTRRTDAPDRARPSAGGRGTLDPLVPGEWRDRRESRDRRSDRVLAQLADDLATIESAAGLLGAARSPMAQRAGTDVVRAHAWRAAWLLRANAIVGGTHRSQFRARSLSSVLGQLREGFAAECRMTEFALQVHAAEYEATVTIDEPALVAGLTGAVLAMLGLAAQAEGAVVKVTAVTLTGELRTIEVSADDVVVRAHTSARFFDTSWSDRPGGWLAGLAAATAKAVAAQHGGDATFVARERRGGVLRLTLNRTA